MCPAELVNLENITGGVGGCQWVVVMRLRGIPGMVGSIREFVPLRDSSFVRLLRFFFASYWIDCDCGTAAGLATHVHSGQACCEELGSCDGAP